MKNALLKSEMGSQKDPNFLRKPTKKDEAFADKVDTFFDHLDLSIPEEFTQGLLRGNMPA